MSCRKSARFHHACTLTLLMILCLFSTGAFAKGKKKGGDAKAHFKSGVVLFEKGSYAEAMEEFQRSYHLRPMWIIRYNIGLCYLKLGYKAEGATELTIYLEKGSEKGGKGIKASTRDEVEKIVADLMPEVGTIRLQDNYEGVSVEISGIKKPGPTKKGEIYVRPGKFVMNIYKGKERLVTKDVDIAEGEIYEVKVPESSAAGVEEKEDNKDEDAIKSFLDDEKDKSDSSGKTDAGEGKGGAEAPKKKPMVDRLYLWIAVGLAGAALAAGCTMGGLAINERNDMRSVEDEHRGLSAAGTADEAALQALVGTRDDHYDTAKLYSDSATGLLAAGGAATIATIILLVLTERDAVVKEKKKKKKKEKKSKASVKLVPRLGGGTLSIVF